MTHSPPSSLFYRTRMSQAAKGGMVVKTWCFYCRKGRTYWAADLLMVYGDIVVAEFGNTCPYCGNSDGCSTQERYPSSEEVGRVQLTRPAGWRKAWAWETEWLELPIKPLPAMDSPVTRADLEARQQRRQPPKFMRFGDPKTPRY